MQILSWVDIFKQITYDPTLKQKDKDDSQNKNLKPKALVSKKKRRVLESSELIEMILFYFFLQMLSQM